MAKEKNLSESLRYIYEHKGIDAFLNEKIIYSILSDLMPRSSKEINWFIDAINIGAINPLLEAEKNNLNKEEYKQKAKKIFEDNEISKSRIEYLLNSIVYGLKWTNKMVSFEDIKRQEQSVKQKQNNSNNAKNSNVKSNQQRNNTKVTNNNLDYTRINTINQQKQNIKKNNQNSQRSQNSQKNQNNKNNQNSFDQGKAQKLEVEYNYLYTEIDRALQSNENYVGNLSMVNIIAKGALNIIVFLVCLSIIISYLLVFKEGYIFRKILVLDIVGVALGIKVMVNNFNNLKKEKEYLFIKNTYKECMGLKNNVYTTKTKFKMGLVNSINTYNTLQNELMLYKNEYIGLNTRWKNNFNNVNNINKKQTKILKLLIPFFIIFIISGVYESRLIYDKDNTITEISKPIVEAISDNIYQQKRACIKSDSANIRRLANKESEVLGKFKKYDILFLTGKSYENKSEDRIWYEAKTVYGFGWISESVMTLVPIRVTVSSEVVNIRNKASLNSKVIDTAKLGDEFYTTGYAVVTSERTWYEIYVDGEKGYWISSNVIREND